MIKIDLLEIILHNFQFSDNLIQGSFFLNDVCFVWPMLFAHLIANQLFQNLNFLIGCSLSRKN